MQNSLHHHRAIHLRNFFTLFVFISLIIYVHIQLQDTQSIRKDVNSLVNSMLLNQTYITTKQNLFNLQQNLNSKSYYELSQAECLTKIYLDFFNNQRFTAQNSQKQPQASNRNSEKIQLSFGGLIFPDKSHELTGFLNCSDILTTMNYLNPDKTDFIYSKFMQEKYGSLVSNEQGSNNQINHNFCVIVNQFNTSTTKLSQNINSIIQQNYLHYKLIVIDNGSSDGSYQIAKVILEDFKKKIAAEESKNKNQLQNIYQIIKEEGKLSLWSLYQKHINFCNGTDYIVFVDGRDSLSTKRAFSILNNIINRQKLKPSLIISPVLDRKKLGRLNPINLQSLNGIKNLPIFTFKVISFDLFKKTIGIISESTKNCSYEFQIQKVSLQILFDYCQSNNKTLAQSQQMLYVYDTRYSQIERNEYYLSEIKKRMVKIKKQQSKSSQST